MFTVCPKTETEDFTEADLQLFRDACWWEDTAEERIRIFDLSGNLSRTLEKNDTFQFLKWDLRNHAGKLTGAGGERPPATLLCRFFYLSLR